jgi:hypothetical protein
MAIIKTQLLDVDGSDNFANRIPSYCTEDYVTFASHDGSYIICSGSGGGEEITKAELITFVQTANASNSAYGTDADVTELVNNWCTARGIS